MKKTVRKLMKVLGAVAVFLYVGWVTLGVAHAQMPNHSCKNKGAAAHSCKHKGMGGPDSVKNHTPDEGNNNGKGHSLSPMNLWKVAANAGTFGLAFQGDEAGVPTSCTCFVSCFISGNGLPEPDWNGNRQ